LPGVHTHGFGTEQRPGRVRFPRAVRGQTTDLVEAPVRQKPCRHCLGECIDLVGEDGDPDTLLLESVEQFRDPVKGPGCVRPAGGILLPHGIDGMYHGLRAPLHFRKGLHGHDLDALSDEIEVPRNGMGGEAKLPQGLIHGVGNIIDGVQQGAVHIEDHCPVRVCFHGSSCCQSSLPTWKAWPTTCPSLWYVSEEVA